jgi:hypothetical protein
MDGLYSVLDKKGGKEERRKGGKGKEKPSTFLGL